MELPGSLEAGSEDSPTDKRGQGKGACLRVQSRDKEMTPLKWNPGWGERLGLRQMER